MNAAGDSVTMAGRTIHYYLMKTVRISGWLLFGLVLVYILTGFSLCGKFGFTRVIDLQTALAIHKLLDWPLVGIFLVHSAGTIYFALRRWGWLKNRSRRPSGRRTNPLPLSADVDGVSPAVKS